jgi:protein O-mannosyl-transferase
MSRTRRLRQANQRSLSQSDNKHIVQVGRPKYSEYILTTICCLLAAISFVRTLKYGFVFDDHAQVVQNPQIQSWAYLGRLLVTEVWSQRGAEHVGTYFRPLFSVWLLIVHTIGGLTPWFWHLSSLLLHVLATLVVFELCLELLQSDQVAFCAAILFTWHPIHIEAVSWISASPEILYSIFVLVSFSLFAKSFENPPRGIHLSGLSLVFWGAALLSKETAVALIPVFPLWAFLSQDGSTTLRKRLMAAIRMSIPFFLLTAAYLVARSLILQRFGIETGRHSWSQVVFTGFSVIPDYLRKLVFPVHLAPFYPNPILSAANFSVWVGAACLFAMTVLFVWAAIGRKRVVTAAVGFLFLPLLPVILGLRIFRDGDLFHDRYLYLPSIGFCLLVGIVAKQILLQRKWIKIGMGALSVCVLLVFGRLTLTQQEFYKNDEAFYGRALEVGPTNALVMDYLGDYYMTQDQPERAMELFKRASNVAPENPEIVFTLAKALFKTGRYAEVEPLFEELSQWLNLPQTRRELAQLSLGQVEIRLGKFKRAEEILLLLRSENYSYPLLHDTLGALYQSQGRLRAAESEYVQEFSISGNAASRQKALRISEFLKSEGNTMRPSSPHP